MREREGDSIGGDNSVMEHKHGVSRAGYSKRYKDEAVPMDIDRIKGKNKGKIKGKQKDVGKDVKGKGKFKDGGKPKSKNKGKPKE